MNLRSEVAKLKGVVRDLETRRNASGKPKEINWRPYPDSPQEAALESLADIVGYGGGAGGMKTDSLIGLALTRHRRAVIFRREYGQLKDIVTRVKDILADSVDQGRFNGSDLTWRWPNGDSVELAAVQRPDDWRKFRGRAKDLICIDEATEFLESQVRGLLGWLRSVDPKQRCRAVFSFNPPSSQDGMWVINFFRPWLDDTHPSPAAPGELRWYAQVEGVETERPDGTPFIHNGETITPQSRTFVPALIGDNPYLRDTTYRAQLQSLPSPLREQLLYGDFKAGVQDSAWQIIPTAWVKLAQARWKPERPLDEEGNRIPQTRVGVDVAHGGIDRTVVAARYGDWFARLVKVPGAKTPDGRSAAAIAVANHEDDSFIMVDAIGYGAACAESLRNAPPEGYGLRAIPVNVASASTHKDRSRKFGFVNLRAELLWRVREGLDPEGGREIALPPDPELLADLTAGRFDITPSGIRAEPKDKISERLKRSPDSGDAVCLAMMEPKIFKLWNEDNS